MSSPVLSRSRRHGRLLGRDAGKHGKGLPLGQFLAPTGPGPGRIAVRAGRLRLCRWHRADQTAPALAGCVSRQWRPSYSAALLHTPARPRHRYTASGRYWTWGRADAHWSRRLTPSREGAVGQPGQKPGGCGLQVDTLLVGHIVAAGRPYPPARCARKENRWQRERMVAGNLVQLCGGQNKNQMLRRLLNDFQEGVEGGDGEHMNFVDDIHPAAEPLRAYKSHRPADPAHCPHRYWRRRRSPAHPCSCRHQCCGRRHRCCRDCRPAGFRQFTALAKILAQLVLPVPREPVNR